MKLHYFVGIISLILNTQPLYAQKYKVSYIEVFGNNKISYQDVIKKLEIKENDSLNLEQLVPKLPLIKSQLGAVAGDMALICCDDSGNYMLFLGLAEDSSFTIQYRGKPVEDIRLPKQLAEDYELFMSKLSEAVHKGQASEDRSKGHALSNFEPLREIQSRFESYADKNLDILRRVLKQSRYDEERIAAAHIIAYVADKKKVIDDLLYAVQDPEETVRNNAARALALIAGYAADNSKREIDIPAEPFIKMLNSHVWTDRNKALAVLDPLTSNRDPLIIGSLKKSVTTALVQMSKWRSKGHSVMAFIILTRLAGMDDKTIFEKWQTITPGQIDEIGASVN